MPSTIFYNKIIIKNNIVTEAQNGFTEEKSTKDVMHDLATEKKVNLTGTFFISSKAYYLLYHKILLSKLDTVELGGTANQKATSDLQEIKHALPQGSIPPPLLFLLHINYLPISA